MKLTSLAALTVATTAATVSLANVSPATAASMKYDLQINGIEVQSGILGGSTTINVAAGSFTTNDSMDAIESVALKLGNLQFNQGQFVTNGSQTNILFSTPSQSLTLFDILPLPQEIGGMASGQATLANGNLTDSVSYKLTKLASVPEPLTILGSAAALGFGFVLKQENSRKKNKVN
ncbi:MAG: PEP-CTERM sorting domain-containing protein [Coleofasciculus sp. G3-WIS-01]|uniref:PEP-CTERM sorting domain-containing protein n=1 Tax=Coleofasciculus sp. G3-WIS-01 TaxID=3069528 RepID=UPI0032FD6270